MGNKLNQIAVLITSGKIVFPDPDWHEFSPVEIAKIIVRTGMPPWWWKPWWNAGGSAKDMKEKPPPWLRVWWNDGETAEGLMAATARKMATIQKTGDPERDFIRKTIGMPPFGLTPKRREPPPRKGKSLARKPAGTTTRNTRRSGKNETTGLFG